MPDKIHSKRLTGSPRARLLAAAALVSSVLVAGCGGSSGSPTVAAVAGASTSASNVAPSGSSGADSSGESSQSEQLQFAQCMRSRGISDFPDPSASESQDQRIVASGVNLRSPTYQAALKACRKYTPAGNMTPHQSAADNAAGLLFSQCMRSHGVPNFPDPITGPTGGQAINLKPAHIDPDSPIVQSANRACQKIIPSGK